MSCDSVEFFVERFMIEHYATGAAIREARKYGTSPSIVAPAMRMGGCWLVHPRIDPDRGRCVSGLRPVILVDIMPDLAYYSVVGKIPLKPIAWMGDSLEVLRKFPEAVQEEIGYALYRAQAGDKHPNAKPFRGFGPGVLEVLADHRSGTYRAVSPSGSREISTSCMPFRRNQGGVSQPQNRSWTS